MKRLYSKIIEKHFANNRQMLFVMGPRQVGKTTIAKMLHSHRKNYHYFNWDNPNHRALIVEGPHAIAKKTSLDEVSEEKPLIIFDEIHKFSEWKNFLKGFFDIFEDFTDILVTGSARLDVYKKGGDSLMGRYFNLRVHPLSVAELTSEIYLEGEIAKPKEIEDEQFQNLLNFGGFPEPFLKSSREFYNQWRDLRSQLLFKDELRDLSNVQDFGKIEMFANWMVENSCQLIKYSSIGNKLQISDKTVVRWLNVLKSFYYCFTIHPWSKNISRSMLKTPKCFLWDWSLCKNNGSKAENFIAAHLLKAVHLWTDIGLGKYGLYFLRDREKREVDFLVTKDNEPWFLVESKFSANKTISPSLRYFQKALNVKHAFQVVLDMPYVNKDCFTINSPIIVPAKTFLSQLI